MWISVLVFCGALVNSSLGPFWGILACLACHFALGASLSLIAYNFFGYACCGLDFLVCCLPSGLSGHRRVRSYDRSCRSNGGFRCSQSSKVVKLQTILFMWFCTWRIGEAAVPGPPPSWSLGVCNPSGLAHKGHLLNPDIDCWVVCETHLSRPAFRQFVGCLHQEASPFRWCIQGEPVPCRSTVSSIGAWSGVAYLSKWPSRALPGGWSQALHASSRLVCTTSFVHDIWVSGVTVYGTPTGPTHPHARETTNGLLTAAIHRIAQSHGPRFVAGDWNHDLDSLDSINGLLALGFKEVQDLFFERVGVCPKPTCRMKTRRDYLFISPELQTLFESCSVDHFAWSDHATVVAHFRGGQAELVQYPWPLPRPILWSQLENRPAGKFVDFTSSVDVNVSYTELWSDVEQCAQECASSQGKPIHHHCLGRGSRLRPNKVTVTSPPVSLGRKGDCQPEYYGSSWQHALMFRQVRRLQSYVRLVCAGSTTNTHLEHKASLWHAILRAPGFKPSFEQWWVDQECLWMLLPEMPVTPPSHPTAVCVFEAVQTFVRQFEAQLNKQRAYAHRLRKGHDMKQVYAAVRRDPPAPVEVLLHSTKGEVESIDHDDMAVEFKQPVAWNEAIPFVHQGRKLDVVFVAEDKLWLESVESIQPGDTIVQHSGVGKLEEIFQAFIEQWSFRWSKHDAIPDTQWASVIEFAQRYIRPVEAPEVQWSVPLFKDTIQSKKSKSACGLDGVSRDDLLSLRPCHQQSILSLYQRAEGDGSWPCQPLNGVVKSLAKVECPGGTNDYRPITILGLAYRVWSSVHARHWLKHLDAIVDPFVLGNRTGCRASHVWRYLLDQVEWSQLSGADVCGLTLDLSKAFNTLPRFPTMAVAKLMGMSQKTLVAWAGALSLLSRRFMVRGSVSSPVWSSCGFPEGCALSCVAMLIIDNVFHTWMKAGDFMCSPVSYVDNWELVLSQPDRVRCALDRALQFAADWDLTIDCSKTFAWGASTESRSVLRSAGLRVRHDERDLGAHVVFTRQLRNRTTLQRFHALGDFWAKLRTARGTLPQKLRAVRTAAWPRAMHGVGAVIVGKKHWQRLRSNYMAAMKFAKPGANPMAQMLFDGFGTDPQLFAIWTSLLDFRAVGSADPHLAALDLVGVAGVGQAQASISEVLCHRIHQLGWSLLPGGIVCDRYGRFNVLACSLGELKIRVEWSWHGVVASELSSRMDFPGFENAHVRATRQGVQTFPIVDQAALRAVLNGTTFTNRHAYHWSENGSTLCPACGQPDGLHHKYWECPFVADLVSEVPVYVRDLLPDLPSWACDRGWSLAPSVLGAWRQYLVNIPFHVDFAPICRSFGDTLDLFTDGSCLWGSEPDFRLASWSVCCGFFDGSLSTSPFQVVSSGALSGLVQTAYRAELFAVYAALCYADSLNLACRIWSDCLGVVVRLRMLMTGGKQLMANSQHTDLWNLIMDLVQKLGSDRVTIAKVTAHVTPTECDDVIETWLATGNQAADTAAKAANQDRPQQVWRLWQEVMTQTLQLRVVGNAIRQHLVEVNRRWYANGPIQEAPEVHTPRMANASVMLWQSPGPVNEVKGSFRRFFGVEFSALVASWWNGLVIHEGASPSWISFAQLYVDWQVVQRHAGVTKLSGKWTILDQAGTVPEQLSFRSRCKHFRLMLQQFAKDANIKMATCTGRPLSDILQCHIGCVSIAIDNGRRMAVDAWLKQRLARPVFGLGESLDMIPPGW